MTRRLVHGHESAVYLERRVTFRSLFAEIVRVMSPAGLPPAYAGHLGCQVGLGN